MDPLGMGSCRSSSCVSRVESKRGKVCAVGLEARWSKGSDYAFLSLSVKQRNTSGIGSSLVREVGCVDATSGGGGGLGGGVGGLLLGGGGFCFQHFRVATCPKMNSCF